MIGEVKISPEKGLIFFKDAAHPLAPATLRLCFFGSLTKLTVERSQPMRKDVVELESYLTAPTYIIF